MIRRGTLVAVALAVALCALPVTAHAVPMPGWAMHTITPTAGQYDAAKISGDRMAWTQVVDLAPQVFTQKYGAAQATRLTFSAHVRNNLLLSGDRIAWLESDGTHNQVWTQKIGVDPAPVQITFGDVEHTDLKLSGDRMVWLAEATGTGKQVVTQVGSDSASTWQLTGTSTHEAVALDGDRVVWEEGNLAVENRLIFTQKIGTELSPIPVTTSATDSSEPQVSGDRIIWRESEVGGLRVVTSVMSAGSPGTAIGLPIVGIRGDEVVLSGDRVTCNKQVGLLQQVLTYKIGVDPEPMLLANGDGASGIQASGDTLGWTYNTSGMYGFGRRMGIDVDAVQMTEYNGFIMDVDGDRILATQGPSTAESKIYLLTPSPRTTMLSRPRVSGRASAKRGTTLTGSVSPARRTTVKLEVQVYKRGRFRTYKTFSVTSYSGGGWKYKARLKRGTYRVRAKTAETLDYRAGCSGWRTIKPR
jgi:hypothetical protein